MHLQLSQESFASLWPMLSDAAVKGAVLMLAATAASLVLARSSAAHGTCCGYSRSSAYCWSRPCRP